MQGFRPQLVTSLIRGPASEPKQYTFNRIEHGPPAHVHNSNPQGNQLMNSIRMTAIFCTAAVLLLADAGLAQEKYQAYAPSRPTYSPYFNLFRNNTGGIPNYIYLRRDIRVNEFVRSQETRVNALEREVRTPTRVRVMERQTSTSPLRIRRSSPTVSRSRPGAFMDRSHYYKSN